jgi:hypothetical protein
MVGGASETATLRWCICRHYLAVVIELRTRTVTHRNHPQLVRPLQSDFGPGRVDKGWAEATRIFI